jgi:hypothetical protein
MYNRIRRNGIVCGDEKGMIIYSNFRIVKIPGREVTVIILIIEKKKKKLYHKL